MTIADIRANYSQEIINLFRSTYGNNLRIVDGIIPLSIRAAETSAEGQSVKAYQLSVADALSTMPIGVVCITCWI